MSERAKVLKTFNNLNNKTQRTRLEAGKLLYYAQLLKGTLMTTTIDSIYFKVLDTWRKEYDISDVKFHTAYRKTPEYKQEVRKFPAIAYEFSLLHKRLDQWNINPLNYPVKRQLQIAKYTPSEILDTVMELPSIYSENARSDKQLSAKAVRIAVQQSKKERLRGGRMYSQRGIASRLAKIHKIERMIKRKIIV